MKILGRSDRVDLPGLGITDIEAKIDTGAWTSSLHCSRAEVVAGNLEFELVNKDHPGLASAKFTVKKFTRREIKNSSGQAETRFVIRTKVKIYNLVILAEFSLSDRENLRFPVLLGRKILRKKFLIDVTEKDLSYKNKKQGA